MTKEKESNSSSFKTWYAKNKEEFNKKRREKYKNDEAYRQRVLETDRKSKQANRKTKEEPLQAAEKNG